jgi:regulator of protease activity HflC (stomatin/prohibitin superfamily)
MLYVYLIIAIIILFFAGIRIVRPTSRGLVETMGKYTKYAQPGFHWVVPWIQRLFSVNIMEQMFNAEPQVIITNDNLNATVDAQVYFRIKSDEESVKSSVYNVNNYKFQIVNLARTALRFFENKLVFNVWKKDSLGACYILFFSNGIRYALFMWGIYGRNDESNRNSAAFSLKPV